MNKIDICNAALRQLKVRPIGSFKENTEEARQCAEVYPVALAELLTMKDWNFCKVKRTLPLIDRDYIDKAFIPEHDRLNYFEYPIDAVKLVNTELKNERPPLRFPPHHHHHHHHHHHVEKNDEGRVIVDVEEKEGALADALEVDKDIACCCKRRMNVRRKRPPKFRVLPPPRNDDGFELRTVKLLNNHFFMEVIATPYTRVDVEYIRYDDNPQNWHPMFRKAFIRYLALELATVLSGKSDAIQQQQQQFEFALRQAQAMNNNECKPTYVQRSRLLRGCF